MESAPIREPVKQRHYESLSSLALLGVFCFGFVWFWFFFFFKWKLFNLTSWHFWGFRTKLIAAAAAWSAVTKKPNSIINLCVSNLGDSGFPGETVLFAVLHLLLPAVSLLELAVFCVLFLMPSS